MPHYRNSVLLPWHGAPAPEFSYGLQVLLRSSFGCPLYFSLAVRRNTQFTYSTYNSGAGSAAQGNVHVPANVSALMILTVRTDSTVFRSPPPVAPPLDCGISVLLLRYWCNSHSAAPGDRPELSRSAVLTDPVRPLYEPRSASWRAP